MHYVAGAELGSKQLIAWKGREMSTHFLFCHFFLPRPSVSYTLPYLPPSAKWESIHKIYECIEAMEKIAPTDWLGEGVLAAEVGSGVGRGSAQWFQMTKTRWK